MTKQLNKAYNYSVTKVDFIMIDSNSSSSIDKGEDPKSFQVKEELYLKEIEQDVDKVNRSAFSLDVNDQSELTTELKGRAINQLPIEPHLVDTEGIKKIYKKEGLKLTTTDVRNIFTEAIRIKDITTQYFSFRTQNAEDRMIVVNQDERGHLCQVLDLTEKKLGEGSFGRVIVAIDLISKQTFAVKYANDMPQKKQIARRLLEGEIDILKRKGDHPYIQRFYRVIDNNKGLYGFMSHRYRCSLSNFIRAQKKNQNLKLEEPLKQLTGLVSALRHLVGSDGKEEDIIIHSDIKPDNLLIDDDGRIVLADFGGVKSVKDLLVANHFGLRTEGYFSNSDRLEIGNARKNMMGNEDKLRSLNQERQARHQEIEALEADLKVKNQTIAKIEKLPSIDKEALEYLTVLKAEAESEEKEKEQIKKKYNDLNLESLTQTNRLKQQNNSLHDKHKSLQIKRMIYSLGLSIKELSQKDLAFPKDLQIIVDKMCLVKSEERISLEELERQLNLLHDGLECENKAADEVKRQTSETTEELDDRLTLEAILANASDSNESTLKSVDNKHLEDILAKASDSSGSPLKSSEKQILDDLLEDSSLNNTEIRALDDILDLGSKDSA